ncbi:class I SAM-dependent methyltransferase [Fodinicurvata sp. EGI_FJ10296]|uniref:class I SAM-dependent methyltransferase n=1 Tax=Fodinicurvata sp. EGI_FJ10296 TaxID=3231908 RepID=UPI0034527599
MTENPESRWFGEQSVNPDEKTRLVRGVFSNVAERYDLMNDLMSGGIHRAWKHRFVALANPRPGERILDVAGGTGDIAFRLVRAMDRRSAGRHAHRDMSATSGPDVVICDLSEEMVRVGRDRSIDQGFAGRIEVVVGNAESLPLPDRCVDAYTIAFGLRNVTRIDTALAEARRVLRPGGRFLCLEFSHVVLPALRYAYETYSDAVIPRLGQMIVGDRESYAYLVQSIRRFPEQQELADRMAAAGFHNPKWINLTGGIAAIHQGWRI